MNALSLPFPAVRRWILTVTAILAFALAMTSPLYAQPGSAEAYYVEDAGQPAGPFDMNQLRQRQAAGTLSADTLAWTAGMSDWVPAGQVPALAPLFRAAPPPMPNRMPQPPGDSTPVSGNPALASLMLKSANEYLVGQWQARGMMPVEGFGPSDAELTVTYNPDGSFDLHGQYRVQEPSSGIVPVDIKGRGHWEAPIEERSPDSNHLRGVMLSTNGNLTMTVPAHFGIPPQVESISESSQIQIIDENSVRDAEGLVWRRIR